MSDELPAFLFSGWQFRQGDIAEAQARGDLDGWTVSSLCSAYLKYQLDRYEDGHQATGHKGPPSLTSLSTHCLLETLRSSYTSQEGANIVAASPVRPQELGVSYPILRSFETLPSSTIKGSQGDRKLVDVDEAILAGERYVRSMHHKFIDSYLVQLKDLASVFGHLDLDGCLRIPRRSPPKGGFEFLDDKRKKELQIHGSDASFITTFNRVTKGILKGLNWDNVFIQGGMVLNTLLHTDSSKDNERDIAECDIDMYIYGVTPKEANLKVDEIYKVYAANLGPESEHVVMKTAKTISFIPQYPKRRIQIVLKLQSSPLESLLRVDLDACSLAFDGTRVLMLPRCARALETGYSVFTMDLIWGHRLGNRRETQLYRVWKYADRGFGLRILPSYVRSLEMDSSSDAPSTDLGHSLVDKVKVDTKPTRIFENEPGLKTLRRIANYARQYVRRFQFGPSRKIGRKKPKHLHVTLLDDASTYGGIPDPRNSLGAFELFMRHCEAWSLDANGEAILDHRDSDSEKFAYDLLEIYDGLPTYKWSSKSTDSMEDFKNNANYYNYYLYSRLLDVLGEKLGIHRRQFGYHKFGFTGRKGYLTNRSSRLIAGDNAGSVQARNFAMPLVIPKALQTYIAGPLANRYDDLPDYNALSKILVPVHDRESYTPTTERVPSLRDTSEESGNIRYWLITNESMWAGQHRVLDEVAEVMLMLFNWTTRKLPYPDLPFHERQNFRIDNPQCIWYMADFFRRRLVLPKTSEMQQGSHSLSDREARLFRAWILARPPKMDARPGSHFDDRLVRIENELEGEKYIEDGPFWRDGDEGTWDSEVGVPVWGDFEDVSSKRQAGDEDTFDMREISAWFGTPF